MSERAAAERSAIIQLATFLRSLSDEDLEAIAKKELRFTLSPTRTRSAPAKSRDTVDYDELLRSLQESESREAADEHLKSYRLRREQLITLARRLDVPAMKGDNSDRLVARIVESTVGFRLRSAAVRGVASDFEDPRSSA